MSNPRFDIHRMVEILFLIIGAVSLLAALYEIVFYGWASGRDMLFVPAMAFAWYFLRRTVRKRIQR